MALGIAQRDLRHKIAAARSLTALFNTRG